MRNIRQIAISSVTVLLFFLPLLRVFTDAQNRFYFGWQLSDGVTLLATVIILAGTAFIAYRLAVSFKREWITRLSQHIFLAVFFLGVYSCSHMLLKHYPSVRNLLGIVLCVLWVYSYARTDSRILMFAKNTCLVFSPLIVILAIQILSWPSWESNEGPANPTRDSIDNAIPVFIFIFDEWSYPRSTRDGEFLPSWENLNRLCEQAIVFRNTRSPDDNTAKSIPKILFQTDRNLVAEKGQMFWEEKGVMAPTATEESILSMAGEHGYNTAVIGFHVPYRTLLGAQVDYVYGHSYATKFGPATRDNTFLQIAEWAALAIGKQKNPISRWLHEDLDVGRFTGRVHYNQHRQRLAQVRRIIKEFPPNTMVVSHLSPPHAPFVFNVDGEYWPTDDLNPMSPDTDGYRRHLGYVDHLIGQFVADLKSAGKFDDSLIIFTADHSWRYDPERSDIVGEDVDRWVPLIIKCPGQTRRRTVDRVFITNQLRNAIGSALRSKANDDLTDELSQRILTTKKVSRPE